MWTRAELKGRARQGLKQYYGYALLVVFIAAILGAGSGGGTVSGGFSNAVDMAGWDFGMPGVNMMLIPLIIAALLVGFAVVMLFMILVSNVVAVGKCRYFSISTLEQRNAGLEELFGGFRKGRYLNIVKVQFLRGLYEFLWSLLLIIPGIVKHYEYFMVPYLVAEYPSMDSREVFRLSKQMMAGHKLSAFVLELSFLGWYILGLMVCFVGTILIKPYYEATMAELYLKLREERLGIVRGGVHAPDADGAVFTQQAQEQNGHGSFYDQDRGGRF